MKHTLIVLTILCLFSCQKTEIIIEEKIETPPIIEVVDATQDLRDQAILGNTLSKEFFSTLLAQSFSHPEIFGLASNDKVDTRTCPTATSTGHDFPITLTLDFGAAPGCTPPHFTLPKVGQIITTCVRPLFSSGPGADFTITLSEDYQEQGYEIIGGSGAGVVFKFKWTETATSYKIAFEDDVVIKNISNGNTIVLDARPDFSNPFGTIGYLPDSGEIEDDPSDPLTYLDNIYFISVLDSKITCTSGSSSQNICLDISSPSGNGLEFQPWECHCITTGVLRINEDSDCTSPNSNANADIIYDFGNGDCDGDVDVTVDGITTTTILYHCN